VVEITFLPQEHVEGSALGLNDGARIRVIADALTAREPGLRGRYLVGLRGCCREVLTGHRVSGLAGRACH
jgi:hypothetical protein